MSEKLQARRNAFTYHAPSPAVQEVMSNLRGNYQTLAELLDGALPASGDPARYTALAFTALEESAMWALRALLHADPECKVISP